MLSVAAVRAIVPPPALVGAGGIPRTASNIEFLHDDSWVDASGERGLEQEIFDRVLGLIDSARRLVLVDFFLFNEWQGPSPEAHRALADELVEHLVAAARRTDKPAVVVISDPINTVYGGLVSEHFETLRAAGIPVVVTPLIRLQDSNPAWSSVWRVLIRPFGNSSAADTLPNPFGAGRVSIRSWLALLNFKANHRKLVVTDVPQASGDVLRALVTSANPHDGSSAHRNIALVGGGALAHDVLEAERAVIALAAERDAEAALALALLDAAAAQLPRLAQPSSDATGAEVWLANESTIRDQALDVLAAAGPADAIELEMFYLAHRSIVRALSDAAQRGVSVRALLDVNADAFGRRKNGVPNVPVAAELVANGVKVRWCATAGEQCHAKWLHVRVGATHTSFVGSGNFTRRNLDDLNLETDLVYRSDADDPVTSEMLVRFERLWRNEPGRTYSKDYAAHADDSRLLAWQYRIMEATGLGTF